MFPLKEGIMDRTELVQMVRDNFSGPFRKIVNFPKNLISKFVTLNWPFFIYACVFAWIVQDIVRFYEIGYFQIGAIVWILVCVRKVDTVRSALVTRLGKRTGEVLDEGIGFVWTPVDEVIPIGTDIVEVPVRVQHFLQDQDIEFDFQVVMQVDAPAVYYSFKEGETPEKVIKEYIKDSVITMITKHDADTVKANLAAIRRRLECGLMMRVLPDEEPDEYFPGARPETYGPPSSGPIPEVGLIDFYNDPTIVAEVNRRLHGAERDFSDESKSHLESMLGMRVVMLRLSDIGLDKATKEAIQAKRQAEGFLKAAEAKNQAVFNYAVAWAGGQEAFDAFSAPEKQKMIQLVLASGLVEKSNVSVNVQDIHGGSIPITFTGERK